MKRILITGLHSYLGHSLRIYLAKWPDQYEVDQISLRDECWKQMDFSGYDALYHTVGLAHQRETAENGWQYNNINCDLAVAVAEKAKADGVGQFIFLSSLSVYGLETGAITPETIEKPTSRYGSSKLNAERQITALESSEFQVLILRPPMVYGRGCKGNFQKLVQLAQHMPVFPQVKNQRSMIYIDNLCEFVRLGIDGKLSGKFIPQDATYGNTTQIAQWAAQATGKHLHPSSLAGLAILMLFPFSASARKAFGTLTYEEGPAKLQMPYQVVDQKTGVLYSIESEKQP